MNINSKRQPQHGSERAIKLQFCNATNQHGEPKAKDKTGQTA